VFLVDGKCSIHEAKPAECRLTGHRTDDGWLHESMADAWNNKEARREVLDLRDNWRRTA
jgi:Fe-S-cluster containining protein